MTKNEVNIGVKIYLLYDFNFLKLFLLVMYLYIILKRKSFEFPKSHISISCASLKCPPSMHEVIMEYRSRCSHVLEEERTSCVCLLYIHDVSASYAWGDHGVLVWMLFCISQREKISKMPCINDRRVSIRVFSYVGKGENAICLSPVHS